MRRVLCLCLLALSACTDAASDDTDNVTELDPGPPLGKEDSAGVPALSATADYSDSQAWVVTNQWEDTTTPDAKLAGMAWQKRREPFSRRQPLSDY